jgi:diguanylate cyclase (GGDEF)-like protein
VRIHGLKDLADAFGRPVADAVLASVAARLVSTLASDTTAGRPDTDDLVVLVPRTSDDATANVARVDAAVAAINRVTQEPVVIDGLPYDARATIGIVNAPEDGEDLSSLLHRSDAAVRHGRPTHDRVATYTPTPIEEIDRRLGLLTDLGAALTGRAGSGDIDFAYQPQIHLETGDVVAVEALLRWTHPQRGAVSPQDLVLVAESTPLMQRLTEHAVDTVTRQLRQWNDIGVRLHASVNVSMRDLHQDDFVDGVLERIARAGIATDQLVIEVTESDVIRDPDQVRRAVDRLTGAGIQMAVDDFGTGFASLQHLRQLNFDQLKIDKGLVRRIAQDPGDRALVRSVIELARVLDLTVVAEGVEDEAVHRTLRDLGCALGQGWFYGRPTTGREIARTLRAGTR